MFHKAIAASEYADIVTTQQSNVDSYRHGDDEYFLPQHFLITNMAMIIHNNTNGYRTWAIIASIELLVGTVWLTFSRMTNFISVIYKVTNLASSAWSRVETGVAVVRTAGGSIADWGLIIARTNLLLQAIEPLQALPFPVREALPRHVDGSHAQINFIAHSSRTYSVRHANALVMRPSIATCWPLLCS